MNIAEGLAHAKKAFGTHQAIVCDDTRYTWHDFDQRTDALARGLAALGVQRGDRVAVLMLNCHRYLEFYPEALPKSGAGKILKRDLREKYWAGKSRQVN